MYTITNETESEVQSWIDKLPDSLVKSQITNLFDNVFPTNRMTAEQLEKFLSFQNALPKEFQPYPQTFAQILKNPSEDTQDVLSESHTHIAGQDVSKAGTKAMQKVADKVADKSKAKEDAGILARNKTVDTSKEKVKPQVVVVVKKGKK